MVFPWCHDTKEMDIAQRPVVTTSISDTISKQNQNDLDDPQGRPHAMVSENFNEAFSIEITVS